MMRPTQAHKPDGYLLGSYRIATAPEPNSSRLTSFKSICFDSPANNVGPWPASLGCTTNSYSSINPSSANASGSVTPPVNRHCWWDWPAPAARRRVYPLLTAAFQQPPTFASLSCDSCGPKFGPSPMQKVANSGE